MYVLHLPRKQRPLEESMEYSLHDESLSQSHLQSLWFADKLKKGSCASVCFPNCTYFTETEFKTKEIVREYRFVININMLIH